MGILRRTARAAPPGDRPVRSRRTQWRITLARRGLAALFVGLAGVLAVSSLRPPPTPTTAVLVAARDLAAGAVLTSADVRAVQVPTTAPIVAATGDPTALVGQRLAGPVSAGEPISATRLLGQGLLTGRPPAERLVFLPLGDVHSAAGAQPGRHVDVYQVGRSEVLAYDLTVLAVVAPGDSGLGPAAGGPGLLVAAPPGVAGALSAAQRPDLGAPFVVAVR